ncbi:MAG TPA: hypothetical protein P5309_01020 [Syntrophomonadaceae bacterium]|nr:hypothetical protein [Syntrophomonadaceae bacterium]
METEITLVFHNLGLRSFIEVDLCARCPRQDDKGCCGFYSPVFYPTDLVYLYINEPDLLRHIFSLDHLTILDASVTVNNVIDGESYRCRFHSQAGGCTLPQHLRESVCRHFVCAGIGWMEEDSLQDWRRFFDDLTDYEIETNNRWSEILANLGITLRRPELRDRFFSELVKLYRDNLDNLPDFIKSMPEEETRTLRRSLVFGTEWIL